MEILLPSTHETDQINRQRADIANNMADSSPEAAMLSLAGACSADPSRIPNGELASVVHVKGMDREARAVRGVKYVARFVAVKPRTSKGPTGLIHHPNGPEIYTEGARALHRLDIPFASEVMDESDAAIAVPHLTVGWVGSRNDHDTAPRYLVRPTSQELDEGIHPLPTLVKTGQDGNLDGAMNALHTIMSGEPVTRSRLTLDGLSRVTTHANPHVGLILRGSTERPDGPLDEILAEEITAARDRLDEEFGDIHVPVIVDLAHAHGKWEGGGEVGQLAILNGLGGAMLLGARIDGMMAESYILPGKQPGNGTTPGLSTTDHCMSQANGELFIRTAGQLHAEQQSLVSV